MKKSSILVIGAIIFLVLVIGITAYLNKDSVASKQELIDNAEFMIMENGKQIISYNMEQIKQIGETNFKANLKKNGKPPIGYEYTGVLLKDILKEAGVSLDDISTVTIEAVDGYAVIIEKDNILQDDNVYLAYKREGVLIGTKESGGKGPYQMIISKDQFSQYWCKFAVSADVN